nr:hypothetical protein [Acidiferrobacter sp. SPIII_3]
MSETLPAQLGCFDLVIVDEASQSDLWALPSILRGKKILVVGDDRQVSPDGAFISAGRIQELKDRFLGDQPYAAVLTPEKSLYDIASTVFAADKVMLREHFRCVPLIIAYSNRVFYDDFIQPLRIPKASERIDPPLVDIYVKGVAATLKMSIRRRPRLSPMRFRQFWTATALRSVLSVWCRCLGQTRQSTLTEWCASAVMQQNSCVAGSNVATRGFSKGASAISCFFRW